MERVDVGCVERFDLRLELAHALAEALAEQRKVRLRAQDDVLRLVGVETHLLDVQFVLHVVRERADFVEQGAVAVDDRHAAQRRAYADLRRLALAAAQFDHLLHPRHRLFEHRFLERRLRFWIADEMHRVRFRAGIADQLA